MSDLESEFVIVSDEFPVLPLKDVVVHPNMVLPLFVGRERSVKALEAAMATDQQILLVAQKDSQEEAPVTEALFEVGTVAVVLQLLRLPDGTLKVLVEGKERVKIRSFMDDDDYTRALIKVFPEVSSFEGSEEAAVRSLVAQFDQYVKLNKRIPPEVTQALAGLDELPKVADTISAHLLLKIQDRQDILEALTLQQRVDLLMSIMETEIEMLQVEKKIRTRVKGQMERNQQEYYLNEQMKAIQQELGQEFDAQQELEELAQRLKKTRMPKEAKEKVEGELKKLRSMGAMSAEAAVSRNYIDTMLDFPWMKSSRLKNDLAFAQETLDKDHYGLEEVKERILEYLAVQQRVKKIKGPILCLVGPPGVGKTSLGASIARATGRKFTRMALGGVRDEAEIRGHRRTYIGSMPGRVVQKLTKEKANNPLFLLDEIDKMAQDFRGDPASAMLEVLDPEQNSTFADHYLEVDTDLSQVMFVATANSLNIPEALRDRMEIIRLSGYTEDEKMHIAKEYLLPKCIKASGLKEKEIEVADEVIQDIIRYYTREAGVRSLEREIAKICRKVVKEILLKSSAKVIKVTSRNLEKYLDVRKYRYGLADEQDQIGQVTGLAWTEVGGELLKIETVSVPGSGKTQFTGSLGDVMKESIQAAVSVVRSHVHEYGIPENFYEKTDLHIHVPEGATPKDGPSAGIAMCTALVSVLSGNPVKADVAMTGEITLRGEVLPIGGLKEKILAAHRGGIKTVIIPEDNKKDLKEIDEKVLNDLKIVTVRWVDKVLKVALAKPFKLTNNTRVTSSKVGARLKSPSGKGAIARSTKS